MPIRGVNRVRRTGREVARQAREVARVVDIGGLGEVAVGPETTRKVKRVAGGVRRRTDALVARRMDRRDSRTDEQFLQDVYREVLHRDVDPEGLRHFSAQLAGGHRRSEVYAMIRNSPEGLAAAKAAAGGIPQHLISFHHARMAWVASLPRAARIIDLGGTSLNDQRGALLAMGYPYSFDDLAIIELPPDDRHDLYKVDAFEPIHTEQGPVRYMYRSMCDLDDIPDGSWDMVMSGQTFEHITPEEGAKLLHDVRRILAPNGVLALDTPNGAITKLATGGRDKFINPDHKVEYTHEEMLALFADAGLKVVHQCGLGYMPKASRTQLFDDSELVQDPGLFEAIEDCFTLAYVCKRDDA